MSDLPITEHQNPSTVELDRLGTLDLLHRINDEDRRVAWAVEREIQTIAGAVDAIADRLRSGGRMHYFGAGTSGRIGVLDASELPPTFSTPANLVTGHIAGGLSALTSAVESVEDDEKSGEAEVGISGIGPGDVVVGLSASGAAPYVVGAVREARTRGALSIAIVNTVRSPLAAIAQIGIALLVGPEVIAGSTRLKAGTAQKLVLNMISTAVMVKLGKIHGNQMVELQANNAKLRARAERLVVELSDVSADKARAVLEENGWNIKSAVVQLVYACTVDEATRRIKQAGGSLRAALDKGPGRETAK